MTNLYKTFDDNFKKEVNALIKQGLKKELPAGAVYSASKKPPEGAREFTTDRGTKYWIPSKKDKEDKQAKPKSLSERFWRGEPDAYKELDALPPKKFAQTINRLQTGSGRQNLMLVHRYGSSEEKKKMKALYEGPWLASDRKARLKQLDWAGKINKKYRAILDKDVEKEKAKPKASSTPKQAKPGKLTRSKTTISDIKSESKEQGSHFFDKDTMKFFGSKVASPIYEKDGKKYFITSEKRPNSDEPRKYTVRQIVYYDKKGNPAKSGTQFIESVDGFQLHDSLQAAKNALAGTKGKAKEDTPKTGREQFTDKQRAELSNEVDISRKNLSVEAEELHLFTVNDADIYRQRETPIIDNLKKKMKKGVYERASAEKLAKYMFDDVAKKEGFGTPDERREAAANWVKWFESDYADGQYD